MKKLLILNALFILNLWAHNIEIKNAFVRQTPPHAQNSAVFFTIYNHSDQNITLINAQSNISQASELHTHIHKNHQTFMQKIPDLLIKAHSSLDLKPGSYHIMLLKLKKSITPDTKINMTLQFSNHQTIELKNIPSKEF
ncbi:copper chaperone PCu(A)C [Campylobacter sp. VicNov18]|uniref:copper chaperone PCu(A)C n=1 Tax=Campylobacter bilis TaxID=2691918 RepID=UPI00130ED830|nr:copper chaperone PCu(A)C [Campylobacter bilis]MPV63509.1 copper chaperone PCu(A)C [Campylobacter hepaticus]MBM0637009.1 copper chaperone PCu(A)C [Campylobacter bilis]MCC8277836.1 copper chaperone PCu(A)C [Campylobacter bilis]MCC8299446.1 copper chaperone PCu(A)C [Campylobacter bilis]MCC8300746.1 copper chaperone PCu(A)C [Campylobacter bilis]